MYNNILIAVDPDQPSSWTDALPVGVALAGCFAARLTLCSVVRDVEAELEAEWSPIGYREMLKLTEMRLRDLARRLAPEQFIAVEIGTGTICGGILDVAERVQADLIILASHPPGLKDHLLAANAARVARRAVCSVFVIRSPAGSEGSAAVTSAGAAPAVVG